MPSFSALGKFFGNSASNAAGYAAGAATARTLDPLLQQLANETWTKYPDVPPDAMVMANGVAQGQVDPKQAAAWAAQQGIGASQFAALVNVANVGPALGYAFEAWRRGLLTDQEFTTALNRTGLEPQWFDALKALKARLLDPADLARGIHKGLIPDPGLLATPAPSGEGNVPAYPVYDIDAVAQAAGFGYSKDDLGVLVGLQGNPMGAHEAAQALFRGVLQEVDYERAIAEGNTRNEWGEAIKEQSRQIPSAVNYVEAYVRNWIDQAGFLAGTARHGMTADDANLLFLTHGRPLTHTQVFVGLLRGGSYDGPTDGIDPAFLKSLQESDMRPEWYNLTWAARYHFPPFFQTINALSKGWIDAETATNWLLWQAYDPDAVKLIVGNVSGSGTTAKKLTPTQIKSAYHAGQLDRATALQRLTADGYTSTDAELLLGAAPANG